MGHEVAASEQTVVWLAAKRTRANTSFFLSGAGLDDKAIEDKITTLVKEASQ